ncbi:hypothetical protein, partial [uncultured Rikenella sp.]|uniref:hypothetical protein n=1 Tax=uncultured Rikenella sp. TaxID=368003 RepID=UPI00262CA9B7
VAFGFLVLPRHSPQAVSAQVTPLGSSEKEQFEAARTRQSPARVKGHILPIGGEPIRQEWPRATEIGVDTTSFRVPSGTARHALGGKSFKNAIVFE